jgi:hypothetical protein
MSVGNPPLLSHPIRLHWAGWETDTHILQQCGWQISASQDQTYNRMQIAFKHKDFRVYGISEFIDFNFHAYHLCNSVNQYEILKYIRDLNVRCEIGQQIYLHVQGPVNFKPVDTLPQFTTLERNSIEDLIYFAPNLARTQEIIVPDKSVVELMEEILKKQDPARQKYFEDKVREDKFSPRQKVHAQIISLVA